MCGAVLWGQGSAHLESIRAPFHASASLGRGYDSAVEKAVFGDTTSNENARSWLYPCNLICYESRANLIVLP